MKVLMGFAIWSFQNGNQFYGSSNCCSHDAAQKQRRPHVLKLRYGQAAYAWSLKHDGDNTHCSGNIIVKSRFEFPAMTCTRTRVQICLFGAKKLPIAPMCFSPSLFVCSSPSSQTRCIIIIQWELTSWRKRRRRRRGGIAPIDQLCSELLPVDIYGSTLLDSRYSRIQTLMWNITWTFLVNLAIGWICNCLSWKLRLADFWR